jgi:hypothetical protein
MAAPVKAFNQFPVVKEAYTEVRDRLKTITAQQNRPELGLVDVPLWNYIHSSVPEVFALPELGHAASGIGPRCEEMVMPLLMSGHLDPEVYAATIRDTARLQRFVEDWIARKPGSRVNVKKKANKKSPEDNSQAAA